MTDDTAVAEVQGQHPFNLAEGNELMKLVANLTIMGDVADKVSEHITAPFNVLTPKEKVKKRPDGYDYIENTWMDRQFKLQSPLYKTELVHFSVHMGWITIIISLTDRITGNSELGADSARIQVRQGTLEPTFKDIIDMGNNVKSALSRAIKNAQSRFGHGADVYGKRESSITDEERSRYEKMYTEIRSISSSRAQMFKGQWDELGVDYSEFLDRWQIYIDRNAPRSSSVEKGSDVRRSPVMSDITVTEDKSQQDQHLTSKVSQAADKKVLKF